MKCYDLRSTQEGLPRDVRQSLIWPFWQTFSKHEKRSGRSGRKHVPDVIFHIYMSLFRK